MAPVLAAAPPPLATRAVYSFTGFPGIPERHLYLHHDGYPTGAAWRFADSLRGSSDPAFFLAAFLSTQLKAEPIKSLEQAAFADYRYQVHLRPGLDPQLLVQSWRWHPDSGAWHQRCGPLPLAVFIQRFLPSGLPD